MLYQNIHGIKDSGFVNQVERSLQKTGKVPEDIRFSLSIPFEHAEAFLKRFEAQRVLLRDGSYVAKADLVGLLMWAWAERFDIRGDEDPTELFNRWIPGLARTVKPSRKKKGPKDPNEKRGRKPRRQLELFPNKPEEPPQAAGGTDQDDEPQGA